MKLVEFQPSNLLDFMVYVAYKSKLSNSDQKECNVSNKIDTAVSISTCKHIWHPCTSLLKLNNMEEIIIENLSREVCNFILIRTQSNSQFPL